MPSYKVKSKGFFGGVLYGPGSRRRVLDTESPFPSVDGKEDVPAWLEAIAVETPSQARARKSAETKARNEAKKQIEDDKELIAAASFLGEGESAKSGNVETL
jgi:hypothetical protein